MGCIKFHQSAYQQGDYATSSVQLEYRGRSAGKLWTSVAIWTELPVGRYPEGRIIHLRTAEARIAHAEALPITSGERTHSGSEDLNRSDSRLGHYSILLPTLTSTSPPSSTSGPVIHMEREEGESNANAGSTIFATTLVLLMLLLVCLILCILCRKHIRARSSRYLDSPIVIGAVITPSSEQTSSVDIGTAGNG